MRARGRLSSSDLHQPGSPQLLCRPRSHRPRGGLSRYWLEGTEAGRRRGMKEWGGRGLGGRAGSHSPV